MTRIAGVRGTSGQVGRHPCLMLAQLSFILALMSLTSLNAEGRSYDTAQRCQEIATTKKTLSDQRQQDQALLKYLKFFQGQLGGAPNHSMKDIDKYLNADTGFRAFLEGQLHGEPPTPAMKALFKVIHTDLDYWTARKLEAEFVSIGNPRLDYPANLKQEITALQETVDNLDLRLANLDAQAQGLNCQAYSSSPPPNPTGAPSDPGTNSGGETVRVKVITTLSCAASDANSTLLGNVAVAFHKQKPDGTMDSSSAPLVVTTGGGGTTDDSNPQKVPFGTYMITVGPEFGKLAWVNLHIVQNAGGGDRFNYDARMGGVSVTVIPISSPQLPEEYQLAVRLTSPQACTQ